jgi:glycine/D-amino acid oxidase-like deaminating enzyme
MHMNLHGSLSVWQSEAEAVSEPRLAADQSTDVCIVGAGIAGMSAAYLLGRAGKSVIVLDAGEVGSGETSRTTAHLTCAIDDRFYRIENWHGEAGSRLAAESHAAAIDRIDEIVPAEKDRVRVRAGERLSLRCPGRISGYPRPRARGRKASRPRRSIAPPTGRSTSAPRCARTSVVRRNHHPST